MSVLNCPNCGAPIEDIYTKKCPYCKTRYTNLIHYTNESFNRQQRLQNFLKYLQCQGDFVAYVKVKKYRMD